MGWCGHSFVFQQTLFGGPGCGASRTAPRMEGWLAGARLVAGEALISKWCPALGRSLLAVPSPPDFDTNNQIENQGGEQKRKKKKKTERVREGKGWGKKGEVSIGAQSPRLTERSRSPERLRSSHQDHERHRVSAPFQPLLSKFACLT